MDLNALSKMIEQNRDVIVGIKTAHWQQPNFISVQKAVEAGNRNHLPVMVDFGWFDNKSYEQMISSILRPTDISTHVFRMPAPLLTPEGKPAPYMLDARKRGIKFDVGHGGGSFNFALAEPMVKNGFFPDSISTDLHVGSATGVMLNLPNVMRKMLAPGHSPIRGHSGIHREPSATHAEQTSPVNADQRVPANKTMQNGAPWAICITPGPDPVLFASDGYPGRVYKLKLDGTVLGVFGQSGRQPGQFGWIHEIACPSEDKIYVAELLNWQLQMIVLEPSQIGSSHTRLGMLGRRAGSNFNYRIQ